MQVRYQAALRPEGVILPLELVQDGAKLALDRAQVDISAGCGAGAARGGLGLLLVRRGAVEAIARAADGEALFVQQLADAADKQHLVVLVVAPVAAALHRLQLREFLLPIAQDVRLHPAELAYFTDGEVALGGDRRKFSFPAALLHGVPFRPWP